MKKHVYLPLSVSEQNVGQLLEFVAEPRLFGHADSFSELDGTGLSAGVEKAKQYLKQLDLHSGTGVISYICPGMPLLDPESTALALLLISLLTRSDCLVDKLIVCAVIDEENTMTLKWTRFWPEKLAAIKAMGFQSQPLMLVMPALGHLEVADIQLLAALNINLYRCTNVKQIIERIMQV